MSTNHVYKLMCMPFFPFSHGGWILDGFPLTREHWTAMIDYQLLPDCVLSLEDESGGKEKEAMLLKRFAAAHDLPDPSTWQQPGKKPAQEAEEEGEENEVVSNYGEH